eukprot:7160-Heterococcus_DN1.PRE.1
MPRHFVSLQFEKAALLSVISETMQSLLSVELLYCNVPSMCKSAKLPALSCYAFGSQSLDRTWTWSSLALLIVSYSITQC